MGRVGRLDDHRPEAGRMVGEDLVGDDVAGHQPARHAGGGDRGAAGTEVVVGERRDPGMRLHGAGLREVAGQQPDELVQVRHEGAVGALLHAEVLVGRHAAGGADAAGSGAQLALVQAAHLRAAGDVHGGQVRQHRVGAGEVCLPEGVVDEVFLDDDAEDAGQAPGVGAGADLQMDVGQIRRLGAHRIDDDHAAGGILGDLLEHRTGPGNAVRLPGVLAEEDRHFGVFEVAGGVAAGQVRVDPTLAGLLLSERIGAVAGAEGPHQGAAVGAAEMVALPATAVEEDGLAAVRVAHGHEPLGDLGDGRVPVDRGVAAVGFAAQRCRQPVAAVLVVVETQRLVAGVSGGGDVVLVAADLDEPASVPLDLDAAVVLAQDARALVPGVVGPGHRLSSSMDAMRPGPVRTRGWRVLLRRGACLCLAACRGRRRTCGP
jgi:hypothetical protein